MREEILQLPLRTSRVVWRHKAPNIATLLTNSLVPKERNYSASHLCYNAYSARILDNEVESCVRSCAGDDLNLSGPVVFQRCGAEENGLEVLGLERVGGCGDFCFKRVLLIPQVLEGSIKDVRLQASHDFYYERRNGVYVYLRSSVEVAVLNLRKGTERVEHELVLRSSVRELLRSSGSRKTASGGEADVTIYSAVPSTYDFLEFILLLSNRLILRISLNNQARELRLRQVLDLDEIYKFESDVIQCISYGSNPNACILGGKGIYTLESANGKSRLEMVFPIKERDEEDFDDKTIRSAVSITGRLMRLQTARNKNISYCNITGLAIHPVYSNILAAIDSKSSKVYVVDLLQDTSIPLGEFSIPFSEGLGNHTSRFRHIEWVNLRLVERSQQRNKFRSGLLLFCSSYWRAVYSQLELEFDERNGDRHYRVEVRGVKELTLGTWSLEQDREFYSPKKVQMLESNADLLDMILEGFSIDDNVLSQIFHGFLGLTAFSIEEGRRPREGEGDHRVGLEAKLVPSSTSRQFISESVTERVSSEDEREGLVVLALNSCGRLTSVNLCVLRSGREGSERTLAQARLFGEIFASELGQVYLPKELRISLEEFYQQAYGQNTGLDFGRVESSGIPRVVGPVGSGEAINEDLEVLNEQLTKRKYYNSKVYNGFELLSWLLNEGQEEEEGFGPGEGVDSGRELEQGQSGFSGMSHSRLMKMSKLRLPLPITNGFDYHKEFKSIPRVLWADAGSVIFGELARDCVHIPSLETQPFPLCSCRYFEENAGTSGDEDSDSEKGSYYYAHLTAPFGARSPERPSFDIVGAKDIQYNSTLEEYLSFVRPEDEQEERDWVQQEKEVNADKIYILKDTLGTMSDWLNSLHLVPVSNSIAENYLKYNKYLGGKQSQKSVRRSKWRISQSCSRMRQPGCLLKHLIINELEVNKAFEEERRRNTREGQAPESEADDEDTGAEEELEEEEEEWEEEEEEWEEEEEEWEEEEEDGGSEGEGGDCEDGYFDEEELGRRFESVMEKVGQEERRGLSAEGKDGLPARTRVRDSLPRRGVYISKKLIRTLRSFWDESCEYYGLDSSKRQEQGEGENEDAGGSKTIDVLRDDLSQWHNYPFVSFESVDARIGDKEQLRLSLMSYVDTQLSNV
ncbi:hypothetical protein HWI79_1200 [Cryptosporidium felis]|nr:hypothetical protein HWI79_1200 [Cryptosporidium felis]